MIKTLRRRLTLLVACVLVLVDQFLSKLLSVTVTVWRPASPVLP